MSEHPTYNPEDVIQRASDLVEPKKSGAMSRRNFLEKTGKLAALSLLFGGLAKAENMLGDNLDNTENSDMSENITPEKAKAMEREVGKIVADARKVLESGNPVNFLDNKYVVSGLYYSDRFLETELTPERIKNNPPRQILAGIKDLITPELRRSYIKMLRLRFMMGTEGDNKIDSNEEPILPINTMDFGSGDNHPDAVDIFIDEGSPVRSMRAGLVVLAENGWRPDNMLSTTSPKGGNQVIVYSPVDNGFTHYCHLEKTPLEPGDVIVQGAAIGKVGHSGKNASRPGHGRHLHLEINYYNGTKRRMEGMNREELKTLLRQINK